MVTAARVGYTPAMALDLIDLLRQAVEREDYAVSGATGVELVIDPSDPEGRRRIVRWPPDVSALALAASRSPDTLVITCGEADDTAPAEACAARSAPDDDVT